MLSVRMALLVLVTVALIPNARSAPLPEFEELLSRPISQLIFKHTREGNIIAERVIGARIASESPEARLTRLIRTLVSDERYSAFARDLEPRLRNAETEIRSRLSGEKASDQAMSEIGSQAATYLELHASSEGMSVRLSFVSEPPSQHGFAVNRSEFLAAQGGDAPVSAIGTDFSGRDLSHVAMAGEDLRITRWQGTLLGDLRATDLRAADLRGARIDSSTRLDGAIYDQFTGLPFSRADATACGMTYQPSKPPESFAFVDVHAAESRAARAAVSPPAGAARIPIQVLRRLPELSPASIEGVDLFAKPKHVQARGTQWVRFEAGSVRADTANATINDLVQELASDGGQVRRLVFVNPRTGAILQSESGAYFTLEGGRPVIAVGERAELPTLFHEREHLRDWMKVYRGFLAQGKSADEAFALAREVRATAEYKVMTERHAVTAQLQAQRGLDEAAGLPLIERRYRFENRYFAATVSYPEREGLGRIFGTRSLAEVSADPQLRSEAERFGRRIARNALLARRSWFLNLGMTEAADFTRDELFFEVIAGNASRYAENGSLNDIQKFFNELLPSEIAKLPDDEFRRKIAPRFTR